MKIQAKLFLLLGCLAAFAALSGCLYRQVNNKYGVERYITVKSDPPGARLLVDNEEVGTTPYTLRFVHYGTRKFTIIADGYRTVEAYERIRAPWYQWFPIDFFVELILPVKVKDERLFLYALEPEPLIGGAEFEKRARDFRDKERLEP
jgi:hypothetical protein